MDDTHPTPDWFVTRIGNVSVSVRWTSSGLIARIGPDEASALLGAKNRHLRPSHVRKLAREMTNGWWDLNGESMKFSHSGDLLDGQHRCHAIIESGVTIETAVWLDLPTSAQDSIDRGASRRSGDALYLRDEPMASSLSAVIGVSWRLENHLFVGGSVPSTHDVLAYLTRYPEIRDSNAIAGRIYKSPVRLQRSIAGGLHHRMMLLDHRQADEFMERLIDGLDIAVISNARDRVPWIQVHALMTIAALSKSGRCRVDDQSAWNAFRAQKPVTTLKWSRSGAAREAFPEIR